MLPQAKLKHAALVTSLGSALPPPQGDGPCISIVSVLYDESPAALRAVVERYSRWQSLSVEVVVVSVGTRISAAPQGASWVHCIAGPVDLPDTQLRQLGFAAARGDVIIMVDDPLSVDDAWIRHVARMDERIVPASRLPETEQSRERNS